MERAEREARPRLTVLTRDFLSEFEHRELRRQRRQVEQQAAELEARAAALDERERRTAMVGYVVLLALALEILLGVFVGSYADHRLPAALSAGGPGISSRR
jgi:fatty acid desaturase